MARYFEMGTMAAIFIKDVNQFRLRNAQNKKARSYA
jgi:hypothetical protein